MNHGAHSNGSAIPDVRVPSGGGGRSEAGKFPERCVMVEGRAGIYDGECTDRGSNTDNRTGANQ